MRKLVVLGVLGLAVGMARADDGAASIAAGGIVLMKREPRIVMAKEILRISERKIIVDYDFRNDSEQDITTVVAFPVPDYSAEDATDAFTADAGFGDFKLMIEGSPVKCSVEARAFMGKREITSLLNQEHIDIASFGHSDVRSGYDPTSKDFEKLPATSKHLLIASGAFKDGYPTWKVHKKYYWTQTFPARKLIHIRHEYMPVVGSENTTGDPLIHQGKDAMPEYASVCPDVTLRQKLKTYWAVDLIQDRNSTY